MLQSFMKCFLCSTYVEYVFNSYFWLFVLVLFIFFTGRCRQWVGPSLAEEESRSPTTVEQEIVDQRGRDSSFAFVCEILLREKTMWSVDVGYF